MLVKKQIRVRGKQGRTYMRSMFVRSEEHPKRGQATRRFLSEHGKAFVGVAAAQGFVSGLSAKLAYKQANKHGLGRFGSSATGLTVGLGTKHAANKWLMNRDSQYTDALSRYWDLRKRNPKAANKLSRIHGASVVGGAIIGGLIG